MKERARKPRPQWKGELIIKTLLNQIYPLDETGIDKLSEELETCLGKYQDLERKEILRIRLSAEDILLTWMHSGVNLSVQLKLEQRGKNIQISLLLDGLSYSVDPMDPDNLEESSLVDNLMAVLGISWIYQYEHGRNTVYTSVTVRKRNNLASVGIALITAVFIIIILRLLPEQIGNGIQTYGIDLVYGYCS